ncbi:hypothetical protein SDC9_199098 [bioreactor metagenome]|uniref:Uncharacterized protein n=1 Tax=bioreactor metagenome TaxID=1076179 RepID=A0A645IKS3_9ZZZZ
MSRSLGVTISTLGTEMVTVLLSIVDNAVAEEPIPILKSSPIASISFFVTSMLHYSLHI